MLMWLPRRQTCAADQRGGGGAVRLQDDAERQRQDEAADHNPLVPWSRRAR